MRSVTGPGPSAASRTAVCVGTESVCQLRCTSLQPKLCGARFMPLRTGILNRSRSLDMLVCRESFDSTCACSDVPLICLWQLLIVAERSRNIVPAARAGYMAFDLVKCVLL